MNIRLFTIALFISAKSAFLLCAQSKLTTLSAKELAYFSHGDKAVEKRLYQEIRALPSSEKSIIVEKLKEGLSHGRRISDTPSFMDYEPLLVAAGDMETIDLLIGRYLKASREIHALSVSGNPTVIVKMGEHILGDNTLRALPGEDNPALGTADGTWRICRSIILAAPEFSSELKAWAEIAPETMGWDGEDKLPNEHISVIRQWWNLNRAAFQAGEFAEVKPGGVLASWKQAADRKAAQRQARTNSVATSGAESVPKPPPGVVAPVAEPDRMPTGNYAFYAAVAAFLLATVFAFRNRLFQKR